jgi:hypothetical protein
MAVKLKLSALAEGHWYEYAIRFVLGGAVTMLAGWIAASGDQRWAVCFSRFRRYSLRARHWWKNVSAKGRRTWAFKVQARSGRRCA